uniref:endo-polygalacturonase n=1 Tax=Chrysomela tremula TaxID=63687 RepID=E7CIR5_CHRTR|nr:endopolygalacturonase [Chrysomela tremula]
MISLIEAFVSLLVIVVSIKADSNGYEPIDYQTAKNLTADYCYVKSYEEVDSVVQNCNRIVLESFEVPAGKTLTLKLRKKAVLLFEGTLTFGMAYWDGSLIEIRGENIQVIGGTNHLIHGHGEKYWDGLGVAGVVKPKRLMSINVKGGTFTNINIKNCPVFCVAIMGNDLTFSGFNIDLQDGFKNSLGRNTDGMGFSHANNIVIENSKITNQDDCVNALGDSSNAVVRNVHCWGSHGFSVTSGMSTTNTGNDIRNITFEDCSIGGSLGGIHVKTLPTGGHGTLDQITYRNIEIKDTTRFAIEVQQDYPKEDGHSSNNIIINDLNLINVTGSVKGKSARGVRISCGSGSCTNWKWSGVKITGAHKKDDCNFHPNGYSC